MRNKNSLRFGVAAMAATLLLPLSFAQTPDGCMGLRQAMELASKSDPAVATSQAREREADANIQDAKSLYRPQLSAFARTGIGDVGLIDSAIQNQIGLSASQRVIDFGDARFARRAARFDRDASGFDTLNARDQAASEVAAAVFDILESAEAITFTERRRSYFKDQLSAIEAVLDSGGATVSERAEISAQLANAEAFFLDLQSNKKQAETVLQIAVGGIFSMCEAPLLEAEFSTIGKDLGTIEAVTEKAISRSPQLQARKARSDSLEEVRKREARARLPVISVVGSAAFSSGVDGDFELQERVGLDVTVPILSGRSLTARSNRASARRSAAVSEVAEMQRQLEEDVRLSFQRILFLEAQLITRKEFEARSLELLEFATFEYEAGTRALPELVDARLDYEQAGLQRIGIKFDLLRERLRLLSLTSSLL